MYVLCVYKPWGQSFLGKSLFISDLVIYRFLFHEVEKHILPYWDQKKRFRKSMLLNLKLYFANTCTICLTINNTHFVKKKMIWTWKDGHEKLPSLFMYLFIYGMHPGPVFRARTPFAHTHIPEGNLDPPISITFISLARGRKPAYPEETLWENM